MNALNPLDAPMTKDEAESIVRRLAERSAFADGPKVGELAEALGVPPEEVAQTLAEIRATVRPKRRSSRRERRVWLLSGLLAVVIAGGTLGAMEALRMRRYQAMQAETSTTTAAVAIPNDQAFRLFLDGADMGSTFRANFQDGSWHSLPDDFDDWFKANPFRFSAPSALTSAEAEAARRAAREGRWTDVPDLRMRTVELRRPDERDNPMRWAVATVPIYTGDDALVAEAVGKERRRLLELAIEEALNGLAPATGAVGVATAGGN